jgi:hypothetical protein
MSWVALGRSWVALGRSCDACVARRKRVVEQQSARKYCAKGARHFDP